MKKQYTLAVYILLHFKLFLKFSSKSYIAGYSLKDMLVLQDSLRKWAGPRLLLLLFSPPPEKLLSTPPPYTLMASKYRHLLLFSETSLYTDFPLQTRGLSSLFFYTMCTCHPHSVVSSHFWLEKYSKFTLLWPCNSEMEPMLFFSYQHNLFLELIIFFLLIYLFLSVWFVCVCFMYLNIHSVLKYLPVV